ncbi:hypothetical protein ABPG73_007725 [Tetrahymena malaccensis]
MGKAADFNQNDLTIIKQYYQNQNCLTISSIPDYPIYQLTGSSCLSNNDIIFTYSSNANIQKVYFQLYLVIKNQSNPNLVSTLNINGQAMAFAGFQDFLRNIYSYNILESMVTVNSNQITIRASTTSQLYSYQTSIQSITLAVQFLDIGRCKISQIGASVLGNCLKKLINISALTIDLRDNLLSGRKSCQKLLSQVKKIKRLVKSKIIIGEQEGGTEDSDIEDSENEDQDQNYLSDQNEQFIEDSD